MKTIVITYGTVSKPDLEGIENSIMPVSISILENGIPKVIDFITKSIEVSFINPFTKTEIASVNAIADSSGTGYIVNFPAFESINNYPFIIKLKDLSEGNFEVLAQGDYSLTSLYNESDSIDEFILVELPNGLSLTESFKQTKKRYWQMYLAPTLNIQLGGMFNESIWGPLANALIAKLIVNDSLILALKGNLTQFRSSDGSGVSGGGVKSITTGPNVVEFYDVSTTVSKLLSPNNSGLSALDQLNRDIAMLSERLGITLNYVGQKIAPIIIPPFI
jgi:hypothetical protein